MAVKILKKVARLPDEYQEVEYIESTGTQYINTGFKPNQDSRIDVEWFKSRNHDGFLCGERTAYSSPDTFDINVGTTTQVYLQFNKYSYPTGFQSYISTKYISSLSKDGGYMDGVKLVSFPDYDNFVADYNIFLFGLNQGGAVEQRTFFGGIYSCQIYDSNTLVRDFVPCYRKSDGVIGLYDLANDVFYTNAGSGSFLKGEDVTSYTTTKKVKMNVLVDGSRLPSEYQQVEYIESTGTQYIDTGINQVTPRTEIEIDFKITQSKEYQALYCSRVNAVQITRTLFITNLGGFRNDVGSQRVVGKQLSLETMYNLQSTKTDLILNDEIIDSYNLNATIDRKLTLLNSYDVIKQEMSPIYGACVKVYKCKIFEDGIVIRDFIPCYRKTDNVIGLYDLVNDVFYTNAGTGTFLKGANVNGGYQIQPVKVNIFKKLLPEAYQQVEYIEGTGTQYIDTGVKISSDKTYHVEYDVQLTKTSRRQLIGFGGGSNQYWGVATNGYYEVDTNTSSAIPAGGRDYVEWDYDYANKIASLTINSTSTQSTNHTNFTNPFLQYLLIYCIKINNQYAYYASAKLYSNKVYEEGVLVRNFIPCYRKSDGEIGLYDLVGKSFYTNNGTGTFAKGENSIQYIITKI